MRFKNLNVLNFSIHTITVKSSRSKSKVVKEKKFQKLIGKILLIRPYMMKKIFSINFGYMVVNTFSSNASRSYQHKTLDTFSVITKISYYKFEIR